MERWLGVALLALAVLCQGVPASAEEAFDADALGKIVEEQNKKIDQLMKENGKVGDILLRVKQLENEQAAVRQSISEGFRRTESLASKLDNASETEFARWAGKVRWSGDFRYRHEFIDDESKFHERNRQRIRVRLGLDAHPTEDLDFFVRIVSGSNDPGSTNQTLGSCWTTKGLYLDRAYFDYHPEALHGIHVLAGKMGVPFFKPGKEQLIFDGDLSPEGIALKYGHDLGKSTRVNLVGGGFWLKESGDSADNLMYGGQVSIVQQASENTKITFGGTYYHYTNMDGAVVCYDPEDSFGNAAIMQADGTLVYADDFHLLEAFAQVDTELGGLPFSFYGDFVHNTEANTSGEDTGWLAGVKVGKAKKPGSWQFDYNYRDLEADAVVGVFTDSDFVGVRV